MTTINNSTIEINNYWRLIKNTSKEVKMRLATLILQSLTEGAETEKEIDDDEATDQFINRFCGSWNGDESAEEIIDNIYSSRHRVSRPPVCLD